MKYINLELWTSIHSIVLFAYKVPWEKKRGWKTRKDTLNKNIIKEESAMTWWLEYTDTLLFFKDRKDEAFGPTLLIPLTKEKAGR